MRLRRARMTRRTFAKASAISAFAWAAPATIRSARAQPTQGVRFVDADQDEAVRLARQYNMATAQVPRVRAVCETMEGVSATIRWARDTGTSFAIRSGGHCFAGTSAHPALVIDVRNLDHIAIDASSGVATVGPGATLADLYRAAFAYNRAPAAGWCGDVGVGGHVLGGGLGYQARAHGLLCDHLQALTVVTADGRVKHCSHDENPNLLWAHQGGGGGLALATSFEIALLPVNDVHVIRVFGGMAPEQMPHVIARWMEWSANAPRLTSSQFTVATLSDGRLFGRISGLSEEEPQALIAALNTVADGTMPVDETSLLSGPFAAMMEAHVLSQPAFYVPRVSHSAVWPRALTADQIAPMMDRALAAHSSQGSMSYLIEAMGGAIADKQVGDTAFAHRQGAFLATVSYATPNLDSLSIASANVSAAGRMLWLYASARGYTNYRDLSLDDYETAYWGDNVARLRAIKQEVDPDGVFDGRQTIRRA